MSQNGADWLGRHGYAYPAILRFFYGADLDLTGPAGDSGDSGAGSGSGARKEGAAPVLLLALVAAALALGGWR